MSGWRTGTGAPSSRAWTGDALCAGFAALGSIAVYRMLRDPAPGSLGALLASGAVGWAAGCWIVRSRRPALAVSTAVLVIVAVTIEAAVPPTWHHALVDGETWHRVAAALDLSRERTLLAACLLVAGAGATARLAFGGSRLASRPALAVLPALGLVAWSAVMAPGTGAGALAAGIIAVGGATLLIGDLHSPGSDERGDGSGRTAPWPRRVLLVLAPPLAAFCVALAAVQGSGALGTGHTTPIGSASAPTAEALLSNVVGFAEQDPDVVLFRAHTTEPTYWQVATLTSDGGGTWRVPAAVARAMDGPVTAAPARGDPVVPGGGGRALLTGHVTIAAYRGRVLPVPIGTTTVGDASPTGNVDGAFVQSRVTAPGEHYDTTAIVQDVGQLALSGSSAATGSTTTPNQGDGAGSEPDGATPPIPAEVHQLATQVVSGAVGRQQMVQQLVNWFRSGRFGYTTAMQPPPPPGLTSVEAFLARTRSGNCQTFTDAFAQMAQSLGIPVRVAVGFTSGTWKSGGGTTVTGADAHTWPQVYLGQATGWISVEPTPASSVTPLVPVGVLGVGPVTSPPNPSPRPQPGGRGGLHGEAPSIPPLGAAPNPTVTVPSVHGTDGSSAVPWIVLGVGAVLAALGALLVLSRRRRKRVARDPYQEIVDAWQRCARSLRTVGFECPAPRTHVDHAHTLRRALTRRLNTTTGSTGAPTDELARLSDDVELVALLEREARYAGRPVDADSAAQAVTASRRVQRTLRHQRPRRAVRALVAGAVTPGQEDAGTLRVAGTSTTRGAGDQGGHLRGADRAGV